MQKYRGTSSKICWDYTVKSIANSQILKTSFIKCLFLEDTGCVIWHESQQNLPHSRRNVTWNSCQKDKWKGLLTYCPNCQFCNNYQNLKLRFDLPCYDKKPKKFCMILGSKRNWENILYQMEQRNNEIIESVLDMKAAMADTCSKIHTLSL